MNKLIVTFLGNNMKATHHVEKPLFLGDAEAPITQSSVTERASRTVCRTARDETPVFLITLSQGTLFAVLAFEQFVQESTSSGSGWLMLL